MTILREEVAKGIWRFGPFERPCLPRKNGAGDPSGPCVPSIVVGEKGTAIVDPGETSYSLAFLLGMEQLGIDFKSIQYICLTHIHLFHCQAASTLIDKLPNAKVVVHPRGAPHLIDPTRLNENTIEIEGPTGCELMKPIPEGRIIAAEDGQLLDLGGRELEMVYFPGHAPHGMAIFDRLTRAIFPGDYDTAGGIVFNPGQPGSIPPLLNSIRRVQTLNPSMVIRFARPGVMSPDIFQGLEAHALAVERVCLEGLKQKLSMAEINNRVAQVNRLVPFGDALESPELYADQLTRRTTSPAFLASLIKKYPDLGLELPSDVDKDSEYWGDHYNRPMPGQEKKGGEKSSARKPAKKE
ncbi:MAG: MBL fold metallo-hydrolase [Dehalococcoidales bacterium]|nr:MBL fold metallo-hydrolase [Dehalococcoidales bacterium]